MDHLTLLKELIPLFGSMLILLAVLYLPGMVVGAVSGLRTWWTVAAAPALTFAVCGLAGVSLYRIGVDYSLASVAVVWLLVTALAFGWRVLTSRSSADPGDAAPREMWQTGASEDAPSWRRWLTLAPAPVGVVLGVLANFLPVWAQRAGDVNQDAVSQTWDPNWHASVIRFIQETGIASPSQMGQLLNHESHATNFYPAAWHAFAALVGDVAGTAPVTTMNFTALLVTAVTVPVGAAVLAWTVVGTPGLIRTMAAGFAAVLSSALPVLYTVGFGVGAWPYSVALSLVPVVFGLMVTVPGRPVRLFAAAFGMVGAAQVHLAAVPVLVVLTGGYWLLYRLWAPVTTRLRDFLWLVAPGVIGMLILAPQLLTMIRTGQREEMLGFDATEDIGRSEAWRDALLMMTRHADVDGPVWPVVVLGLAGLVVALFWRRAVWVVAAMFVFLLFTVNGLVPFGGVVGGLLSTYTELHYATPHRLIIPVAFLYSAGAGIAVASLVWLVCGAGARRWSPVASVVLAAVVAAVLAPWASQQPHQSRFFAFGDTYLPSVVDEADLRAMDWLAAQPEAWEHNTFVNPNQGLAWLYPWTGLPSIFSHYQWPSVEPEAATNTIYWHADKIGAGEGPDRPWALNTVDEAVEQLDVGFIMISPPNYWGDEPYYWPMHDGVWNAPGTTPVYRDDNVGIVAVNGVVPDEAIVRMRAESPMPLGTLPTRGDVGLPSDDAAPYIFHPGSNEDEFPLVGRPEDQAPAPVAPGPLVPAGEPGSVLEYERR